MLFLSLPLELWKVEILKYLFLSDKKSLRLVNLTFRNKIVVYPAWKQYVNFSDLKDYQTLFPNLFWEQPYILKIDSEHHFHQFPSLIQENYKYIRELDCFNLKISRKEFRNIIHYIPYHITNIILSFYFDETTILALCNHNPNMKIQIMNVKNLLYVACAFNYVDLVKFMINNRYKEFQSLLHEIDTPQRYTCLGVACKFKNKRIVDILIQHQVNVNQTFGKNNNTTLIECVESTTHFSNQEIIKTLLQAGATLPTPQFCFY